MLVPDEPAAEAEVIVMVDEALPEAAGVVAVVPPEEAELRAAAQMALLTVCVFEASAGEQAFSMHGVAEAVILSLPVVHWQTVSVVLQPEAAMAETKQVRAHDGKSLTD